MNCPICQDDNTQSIKMVILGGSSTNNGKAVGVDLNLDVGIAKLSSTSQTKLAALLDPGVEPTDNSGCANWGCGGSLAVIGIIILAIDGGELGGILLLAGLIWTGYGLAKKSSVDEKLSIRVKTWEAKKKLSENGWICHKCGHTWMP
jgi:hypothetical protein